MKRRRLLPVRYEIVDHAGPAARPPRPMRWRSHDLKGPLPKRFTANLVVALMSLPALGPWPEIDEEAWWQNVLADRRAKPSDAKKLAEKSFDAGLRLDRCPSKSLTFVCKECRQSVTVTVIELCRRFGADRNIRTIGQEVVKCRDKRLSRDGDCPIDYRA